MKLGIWTPLPHTVRIEPALAAGIQEISRPGGEARPDLAFQFAAKVLQKADAFGFDVSLIAERFLGPDLEAWVLATSLAAKTSRITVMPAVHPGMINPQIVAKMAVTLDRISGGRCAINVVNGWYKEEFELFGNGSWLDSDHPRYKRMDEFVQVLKGLWTQDKFSFDGEFYKVADGGLPTKPLTIPSPPIYAASSSDAGKETIARYGDVWFLQHAPDHTQYEENLKYIAINVEGMRRRCDHYGRNVIFGINAHVVCAETMEAAVAHADELSAYGKAGRIQAISVGGLGAGLIGTPEIIADRIDRLEKIGIGLVMLKFAPVLEQLELFGTRVLPLMGMKKSNAA